MNSYYKSDTLHNHDNYQTGVTAGKRGVKQTLSTLCDLADQGVLTETEALVAIKRLAAK